MGLLSSFKKKKTRTGFPDDSPNIIGANTVATPTTVSVDKNKWSPLRKLSSTKNPSTADSSRALAPSSNILNTLSVEAHDDVEVVAFDSQRMFMDQREAIRKTLFENSNQAPNDGVNGENNHDGNPRATADRERNKRAPARDSTEIPAHRKRNDAAVSPLDRFSMPLSAVSGSWDDGVLHKISEEPVEDDPTPPLPRSASAQPLVGPVSLDVSYTDSELGSVLTRQSSTPARRHGAATSFAANAGWTSGSAFGGFATAGPPLSSPGDTSGTPSPKCAGNVVSPNSSRSSAAPMDEREIDSEVDYFRSKGKSPLKGMPEDERMEYQRDEMTPSSPIGPDGFPAYETTEVVPMHFGDGSRTDRTIDTPSNTSFATSTASRTASSFADTLGSSQRSIWNTALACGSGALASTVGATKAAFDSGSRRSGSAARDSDPPPPTLAAVEHLSKRPFYLDEATTVRFLRRITNNGFVLLSLQPAVDGSFSDVNPVDDWKGRTVTMMIHKGQMTNLNGGTLKIGQAPRLEWITVAGGQAADSTTTTSMNLLDISTILTNDADMEDVENMCFFTITRTNGDVHIFEAATLEERNRIVNGLKTVIARWSYHLVAGDIMATSELYVSLYRRDIVDAKNTSARDEMPSLPNPSQTMNRVAHMLLDAGC